jgi:hypothetical protein
MSCSSISGVLGHETGALALALGFGDAGQELAAAAGAERAVDRFDVLVHGVRGDIELVGELFLTSPGHQLGEDLPLARGQARAFFTTERLDPLDMPPEP